MVAYEQMVAEISRKEEELKEIELQLGSVQNTFEMLHH